MSGDVTAEVFQPVQGLPAEMRTSETVDVFTQSIA